MAEYIPFGEWRPDVSNYGGNHSTFLQNVIPRADGYGPVRAPISIISGTGPAASEIRGGYLARKSDGTIRIFTASATKLFMDGADVSKVGGYVAAGIHDRWEFCQYGDLVVAVNKQNVPQVLDLNTTLPKFQDLGGEPPKAGAVAVFGAFLVLGNLALNPNRVQWSAIGNPQSWTPGTNLSDYEDFPDGFFVQALAPDKYSGGFVFQRNMVRRMQFVPGSEVVFQIDKLSLSNGLLFPYSLVLSNDVIYGLSTKGFARLTDSGWVEIGEEKVDRYFFNNFDRTETLRAVHGVACGGSGLVLWTFRSRGSAAPSGFFDKIMCYSPILDRWSLWNVQGEQLIPLWGPDLSPPSLPYYNSVVDQIPPVYVIRLTGGSPGASIDVFAGQPLEAILETPELTSRSFRAYSDRVVPITDANNSYVSFVSRNKLSDAYVAGPEAQVDAAGFSTHTSEGRFSRFRLRIPANSSWSYASGVEHNLASGGRL